MGGRRRATVAFAGDGLVATPPPEPFLLAFLLPAMRRGYAVRIDEPVDEGLLGHLDVFQATWAGWLPHRLRVIPIDAEPRAGSSPASRGITCFSGGVDSAYTLLRHGRPGGSPPLVDAGLLVHGFDIPAEDARPFAGARARAERMLASEGADLVSLWTDLRRLEAAFDVRWDRETHGAALAAALWCVAGRFGTGLIPSTYPEARPKTPWGSHPRTDHHLGGDRLRIVHEGVEAHKLHKVRLVADRAALTRDLRVCWQGEHLDRNCGRCWKCVTTQVCYWLAGVSQPGAFPVRATLEDVARAPQKNEQNVWLYEQLRQAAAETGQEPLRQAIETSLARAARRQAPRTGTRTWIRGILGGRRRRER